MRVEGIAEIIIGFDMIRIEPDGVSIMRFRLVRAAKRAQDSAKVAVKIRNTLIAVDCLANEIDRELVVAALVGIAESSLAIGVVTTRALLRASIAAGTAWPSR